MILDRRLMVITTNDFSNARFPTNSYNHTSHEIRTWLHTSTSEHAQFLAVYNTERSTQLESGKSSSWIIEYKDKWFPRQVHPPLICLGHNSTGDIDFLGPNRKKISSHMEQERFLKLQNHFHGKCDLCNYMTSCYLEGIHSSWSWLKWVFARVCLTKESSKTLSLKDT